jgi:hypothetical protein
MQLHLEGQYGPCCHVKFPNDYIPDSLDAVMKLFNSEQMQRIRRALVDGKTVGLHSYELPLNYIKIFGYTNITLMKKSYFFYSLWR